MAAVTAPRRAGRRWGVRVPPVVRELAGHLMRPARPVLANAAQIPLTVTAYGLLAGAAVAWDTLVGVACTAVLLIVLEHQLADE